MAYDEAERQQFISIFRSNATDVSRACKAFGIARKTFYEWLKNDEAFAAMVEEEREAMKDFGESQLLTLMKGIPKLDANGKQIGWISRPDTACVIFFNKTKNKDRGYDERTVLKREGSWIDDVNILVSNPEQAQQLKDFLTNPPDAQPSTE